MAGALLMDYLPLSNIKLIVISRRRSSYPTRLSRCRFESATNQLLAWPEGFFELRAR